MTTSIRLPGKLSIGRCTGNDRSYVSITLDDASSRCQLVSIEVDLKEFADALFSLCDRPCVYNYYPGCPVGKAEERKTIEVCVPNDYRDREERKALAKKAVAVHEVDGWKGNDSDATNSHNRMPRSNYEGSWYRVMYWRFVDAKEEEPNADA